MFTCKNCDLTFERKWNYEQHLLTDKHNRKRAASEATPITTKKARPNEPEEAEGFKLKNIHTGFKDVFNIYRTSFGRVYRDISMVATMLLAQILYIINLAVAEKNGVKAHLRCTVKFFKAVQPETTMNGYFVSRPAVYLQTTNSKAQYNAAMADIQRQIGEFTKNGSGWVVEMIDKIDLYISRYTPIRGNTYCRLPKKLAKKRAIVNIKNRDQQCFKWSVYAGLYREAKDPQRVTKYKGYDENPETKLDFTGIEQPMALDAIPEFERFNPHVGINVLGYENEGLYPLTKPKDNREGRTIVNLLLLTPVDAPAHYCLITDLGKLLFTSTKHKGRKFICGNCLCHFNTQKRLDQHHEYCTVDRQRVVMPEDPTLKFRNVHRQLRAPYAMYADFECSNEPKDEKTRTHVPNSYGMLGVKRCCGKTPAFETPIVYRGTNPVQNFLENLLQKGEQYVLSCDKDMNLTREQQRKHNCASTCYLCNELFTGGEKHRDHCHTCGEYRGAAHPKCNLTATTNRDVTVFFHNLKKYDGHLIMQEIGSLLKERGRKLECTARGMEEYLSFTIRLKTGHTPWKIRFVDSLAHLPASLETLVKNLPKEKLHALRRFTKHPDLLSQKGFYPYDKVTGPEIFKYPGLLPIEDFYNTLTKEALSPENYAHALRVYEAHGFTNFGQYHDLYLLTDVLLLADVFENFRDFALEHYGLDPAHYITLPSLAWDALLKKTGVNLELQQDPDMYQFFTTGIRGGISVISHRYAKANNPYLPDYDPKEPTSYIAYMDANNLYGWAMNQALPVGGFEWVGEMEHVPDDGYGYVIEVDLEYPQELHDRHDDYPLAPERVTPPCLSPYCQQLKTELGLPEHDCEKLIPNLMDKTHYIIHHRALKQCLELGLKLKKIHRGIRFREAPWMAPYIEFNTEMRKHAKTAFEKDLFKLLNNAVFGKSMENIFNYISVKLTADQKQYEKLVASPLYRDTAHFKNDLHAVMMAKESAELNKPIYTGFSILELSKVLMYEYHYNYMAPTYGERAKLLFTDTDSLCYHIYTDDVYEDMRKDLEMFDTSDYPKDHPLYSEANKKIIGKMKDEMNGVPIAEFVGLRSKMYSLKTENNEKKRAKGIAKAVVKKEITHDDYRNVLFSRKQVKHTMSSFRSSKHEISTVEISKTSLSSFDDKRHILDDGYTTMAYGHKDIAQ